MKCLTSTVWSRLLITVIASVAIAVTGSAGVAGALPYPPIPMIPAAAPAPAVSPANPGSPGDPGADPSVRTAGGLVPQTLVNGRVDPGSFPIQAPTGGSPTSTSHVDRVAPVAVGIGVALLAAWVLITVRRRRTD